MPGTSHAQNDQAALWNGASGRAWVDEQALLDRLFSPFVGHLLAVVTAEAPTSVLDVGCGAGATTLAIARQLGPAGRVTGLDISEPLVSAARERAARDGVAAAFIVADAQHHAFDGAAFDLIVSRFGVMFFTDPVAAFSNLRGAARPGGRLEAIAWRRAADNPFMTAAEQAAAPLLPDLPPRRPDVPGQFAFGDGARVRGILAAAGWSAIDVAPLDVECRLSAEDVLRYLTRLGPVGIALRDADAALRDRVIPVIRAAIDPFMVGDECRFTAACWSLRARA